MIWNTKQAWLAPNLKTYGTVRKAGSPAEHNTFCFHIPEIYVLRQLRDHFHGSNLFHKSEMLQKLEGMPQEVSQFSEFSTEFVLLTQTTRKKASNFLRGTTGERSSIKYSLWPYYLLEFVLTNAQIKQNFPSWNWLVTGFFHTIQPTTIKLFM